MKRLFAGIALLCLFVGAILWAQTIPGAPAYRLPITITAQKWFGAGVPGVSPRGTLANQPGDLYFDTAARNLYFCAAPVTALPASTGSVAPACNSISTGGWSILSGQAKLALTLTNLQHLNTIPIQVIPAAGAGTLIEVTSCWLDLVFGSANFAGGGTVSIGYDTTSSPAATGTIAATFFTTFTSTHLISVLGTAQAVAAPSGYLNKGIFISAGTADFTSGTGASGILDCAYKLHTGLS